jgi:hypothetical protein
MFHFSGWNLAFVAAVWLYSAGLESSPLQGTIGKRALGIGVTDEYGDRITFARGTGRHFAKILSFLPLGAGYLAAAFTERSQGFHDKLAGTLVLDRDSFAVEPPRGTIQVSSLMTFLGVGLLFVGLVFATRNQEPLPRADLYIVPFDDLSRGSFDELAAALNARGVRTATLPNVALSPGGLGRYGDQVDAEQAARELAAAYGSRVPRGSALVGVTNGDLGSETHPERDFVFTGLADGVAVLSAQRVADRSPAVTWTRIDKLLFLDVDALRSGQSVAPDVTSVEQLDRMPDPLGAATSSAR